MPKGCTLHGLRKSLGKMLAEGGATTRQLMEMLGHDDIEHAELYSREAAQATLAKDGMSKVTRLEQRKNALANRLANRNG
jgi:site-specific recombinase XerD